MEVEYIGRKHILQTLKIFAILLLMSRWVMISKNYLLFSSERREEYFKKNEVK